VKRADRIQSVEGGVLDASGNFCAQQHAMPASHCVLRRVVGMVGQKNRHQNGGIEKQLQLERPWIALSRSRRTRSSVSSTTEIPIGRPVRSIGTPSSRTNWTDKEAAHADCPATCSARERIPAVECREAELIGNPVNGQLTSSCRRSARSARARPALPGVRRKPSRDAFPDAYRARDCPKGQFHDKVRQGDQVTFPVTPINRASCDPGTLERENTRW